MQRWVLLVLCVFIAFPLSGCAKKGGEMLARVDDRVITLGEFNKKIEKLPAHYQEMIKGKKAEFLNDIIMEELLYNEALRSNIDKDPEVIDLISEAEKKIIVSRLVQKRVNDKISVLEEDIKKYYDEHSEDFMMPERWRASHILVSTAEEAEEVKEKLAQGVPFDEFADEISKDSASKGKGGDVGYFSKGQFIPEFEEACFALEVGETSDVIKTQFGYHVIKLTEKKSPEVQELSKVGELIKKDMEKESMKQLFEGLTNDLKSKAKITINEELLAEKEPETAEESE